MLLALMLVKIVCFAGLSALHHSRHRKVSRLCVRLLDLRRQTRGEPPFTVAQGHVSGPLVTLIVPCFNEELTIGNCVESLVAQTYERCELVLVDDGSTDGTLEAIRRLADVHAGVRWLGKENGGKASALNHGLAEARGEIVVCIDADSSLAPTAVQALVLSFEDPNVSAVGGNVRVANRSGLLERQQAVEYLVGLTLQRRAFAHLGCMQVISGALAAFRRSALQEVGGYSNDTIVEDMDITIELARRGRRVVYNPDAVAYTEAPVTMRDLVRQRFRWTFGGFQVLSKHRDLVLRRGTRKLGFVGLPFFAVCPWLDVAVSGLVLVTLARSVVTWSWAGFLVFYLALALLQMGLVLYVLVVEKESKRLVLLAGLDSLWYTHVISFVTVKAGLHYVLRRDAEWASVARRGRNRARGTPPIGGRPELSGGTP